jgi:multidrug efflux pump subunit AcrA (membrane-fusion protein)
VLATAALPVAGCTEVETETATGYEPSTLEPVKGNKDIQRVTFTAEGAKRVDLQTAPVRRNVVPYAALIYDPEGKTYVYTSPKPLEYLREEVKVDRIEGDRVLVSRGPPAGTEVVTVGAAEVYGTELEVPSH